MKLLFTALLAAFPATLPVSGFGCHLAPVFLFHQALVTLKSTMEIDDDDFLDEMEVSGNEGKSKATKQKSTNKDERLKTWVEKYRPSKLDEVVYQHEVVSTLKGIVEENATNLPNLLFYGPPGTGKTSTIIALAKQMFGAHYSDRVLELNASDERGIQVVRDKVKTFAQRALPQGRSIPALKIVVLDECDSMTRDAQSALRRTMEKYCNTTRFCLICNYASKIIDPIVSRCTVFRFKPLQADSVKQTLLTVCEKEGYKISPDGLKSLIEISEGDLRRSITLLQTATLVTDAEEEISSDTICEISGYVPAKHIEAFFNVCRTKSYEKMVAKVDELVKLGYSGSQLLEQLQEYVAKTDELLLTDRQKSSICLQIAQNDKNLLDGGDEFIQLLDVGGAIIRSMSIT